ncbi:MAG: hypothetical protein ACRDL7_10160, partial [Gaiellaceae bacterium]
MKAADATPTEHAAACRWGSLIALIGLALYTVFFYRDLLFENRVYVFRDTYALFATYEHTARMLARWHWPPLWDPFSVLGRPFAADPVTGVFYPLNYVLRLLPEAHAINLSIILHHFIAASGMFALLRVHQLRAAAAALGALVFGFGGMFVSFDNLTNGLQSATWLPWVIFAFELWCRRRTATAVLGLAVALALAVLGGMPEFVVFADVLVVALAVDHARSGAGPSLRSSLTVLLLANVVAVGFCAVEIVPFIEFVMHSSRVSGLRAEGVTAYSLQPLGLLAFVIPRRYVDATGQFDETAALWPGGVTDAPWALTLYVGVILALLAPAFGQLSPFRRRWWIGIGLTFLTLALGKYLPGYSWLVAHVAPLR